MFLIPYEGLGPDRRSDRYFMFDIILVARVASILFTKINKNYVANLDKRYTAMHCGWVFCIISL